MTKTEQTRPMQSITHEWRGAVASKELEALHAECFNHEPEQYGDRWRHVPGHSLGWVCARSSKRLVGFVNVAWDGAAHAFIVDTMVSKELRRQRIGARLIAIAVIHARAAGCEWLHVDFDDSLWPFYIDACGFVPTNGGLVKLKL